MWASIWTTLSGPCSRKAARTGMGIEIVAADDDRYRFSVQQGAHRLRDARAIARRVRPARRPRRRSPPHRPAAGRRGRSHGAPGSPRSLLARRAAPPAPPPCGLPAGRDTMSRARLPGCRCALSPTAGRRRKDSRRMSRATLLCLTSWAPCVADGTFNQIMRAGATGEFSVTIAWRLFPANDGPSLSLRFAGLRRSSRACRSRPQCW